VRITLIPSSFGRNEASQLQYLTSYLINNNVAIDAGCLGVYGTPQEQARIKHVFISHAHIDHLATLPIFVENAQEGNSECVVIYASRPVLDSLQDDIFNHRVWPDFVNLTSNNVPFLKLEMLESGRPIQLESLRIIPVSVNHVVPTLGFVIEDATSTVLISSDTGPTDEIWEYANRSSHLKAVFLEVTFPDALGELAAKAKHLTPASLAQEARKLNSPVPIYVVHIKARYYDQVVGELQALDLPNLQIAEPGRTYSF
jgi:ribonuclease BN (tRNA processing enzyme)